MVGRRTGSIVVKGEETIALPTYRIARLGIGYCPEERGIFGSLSANENLLLPPVLGPSAMSIDEIYQMFPNLRERQTSSGTQLSGGEQQMLALARILRTGVDILLLDEITEGLAPVIVNALEDAIRTLKQRGYTIVLVEQNFGFTQDIADRHYVIERGASYIRLSTPISNLKFRNCNGCWGFDADMNALYSQLIVGLINGCFYALLSSASLSFLGCSTSSILRMAHFL